MRNTLDNYNPHLRLLCSKSVEGVDGTSRIRLISFDGIGKETALNDVKELIFSFFSALGCAALAADADHSRHTPLKCSAKIYDRSESA